MRPDILTKINGSEIVKYHYLKRRSYSYAYDKSWHIHISQLQIALSTRSYNFSTCIFYRTQVFSHHEGNSFVYKIGNSCGVNQNFLKRTIRIQN